MHRRQMEVFDRARSRAENAFKRGMADCLLAASGLDRAEVERRLEIDRDATHAFIRERAAEARREGKDALARQRVHAREDLPASTTGTPQPACSRCRRPYRHPVYRAEH